MNFENSKASDPDRLLLNLTDKIDLRRKDNYVALTNLSIYYRWKNVKTSYKNDNVRCQLGHEMKNLNYLMDNILYQIFKIILNISLKKHETVTDNPSVRICINKTEKRITFKIKTGYYLKPLTPETMN